MPPVEVAKRKSLTSRVWVAGSNRTRFHVVETDFPPTLMYWEKLRPWPVGSVR
ncbi:hypothetical protein KYC5002_42980 [Archangium violaceum]|uniref:hypothetical protein n=1 Tax=Archangium violaceum TaxID=83451 RepID=UPI002B298EC8|nr:hypothetical protein KYC5002_42980 [Archangium gephyra]